MPDYAIIETDDGLTVMELDPAMPPEETAVTHAGVVVDPGPYHEYEEACDAMMLLKDDDEEEDVD